MQNVRRYSPPSQESVEGEARDYIKERHGHITKIAALTGLHRSTLSRGLNADDPQHFPLYDTILILEAADYLDAEMYEGLAGILKRFMAAKESARATALEDAAPMTAALSGVIQAYIERRPSREKLRAVRRALDLLRQCETGLMLGDAGGGEERAAAGTVNCS